MPKPIPEGYATVTPYLVIKGAAKALDWYKEALGAEVLFQMPGPDGRIMHAEVRIGDSIVMICDEFPEMETSWKSPESLGGVSAGFWIYSEDCDKAYERALAAGARGESAPADMFWGDRYGRFGDPFGHSWAVATHKEDVSPEEIEKRQKEFLAGMAAKER
jgi:PhnB protein